MATAAMTATAGTAADRPNTTAAVNATITDDEIRIRSLTSTEAYSSTTNAAANVAHSHQGEGTSPVRNRTHSTAMPTSARPTESTPTACLRARLFSFIAGTGWPAR